MSRKRLLRSRLLIIVVVIMVGVALFAMALGTGNGGFLGTAFLRGTPSVETSPGGPIETAVWPTSTAAVLAETTTTPTALPATQETELPTATSEPPTATAESPTATVELPTATAEPPTATAEPPTATNEPPTATAEPPTATVEPPTATLIPRQPVRPILECVTPYGNGYMAYFGYENPNPEPVTLPVGTENQFAPGAADQGQPTVFAPGRSTAWPAGGFGVVFTGASLSWSLDGLIAQAAPDSPLCAYQVRIEDMWYDAAGNPLDRPPADLPPGFTITAQSGYGSATCSYANGGSELTCRYENRVLAASGDVLWVPAEGVYMVSEAGLPPGWQPFAGVGLFPGRGPRQSFTHIIDNRAPGAPGATATPIPLTATPRWEAPSVPPVSATPIQTATPLPPQPVPTSTPTAEAPTAAPPTATATPLGVAEAATVGTSPTAVSGGEPTAIVAPAVTHAPVTPATTPALAAPPAADRSPLIIGLLLLGLGVLLAALLLCCLRIRPH